MCTDLTPKSGIHQDRSRLAAKPTSKLTVISAEPEQLALSLPTERKLASLDLPRSKRLRLRSLEDGSYDVRRKVAYASDPGEFVTKQPDTGAGVSNRKSGQGRYKYLCPGSSTL